MCDTVMACCGDATVRVRVRERDKVRVRVRVKVRVMIWHTVHDVVYGCTPVGQLRMWHDTVWVRCGAMAWCGDAMVL